MSSNCCSQTCSVDLRCQYCERHGPWRNGIKCNSMWISYLWAWEKGGEEGFFKVFLFLWVFESLSDDHACFRDYTCSHNWFTPFIQISTASVASTHVCTLPITSSNPNLPTKLSVSTLSSSKKRLRENCSRPSSGLGPHQVWAVLLKTFEHITDLVVLVTHPLLWPLQFTCQLLSLPPGPLRFLMVSSWFVVTHHPDPLFQTFYTGLLDLAQDSNQHVVAYYPSPLFQAFHAVSLGPAQDSSQLDVSCLFGPFF